MNQGNLLNSFGLFSAAVATHLNIDACEQSTAKKEQMPDLQLTEAFIEAARQQLQDMEQLDAGATPSRMLYLETLKPILSRSLVELEDLLFPASRSTLNI